MSLFYFIHITTVAVTFDFSYNLELFIKIHSKCSQISVKIQLNFFLDSCRKSLRHFRKAAIKYKDHKNLLFAIVDEITERLDKKIGLDLPHDLPAIRAITRGNVEIDHPLSWEKNFTLATISEFIDTEVLRLKDEL